MRWRLRLVAARGAAQSDDDAGQGERTENHALHHPASQSSTRWSTFAAQMKSFSDRPLTVWVE